MKTINEIQEKIEELNSKRIESIKDREDAKTNTDHTVAHNLVLVYAMQQSILEWALSDS